MVRQWSATPVSAGSNPACASQKTSELYSFWGFFVVAVVIWERNRYNGIESLYCGYIGGKRRATGKNQEIWICFSRKKSSDWKIEQKEYVLEGKRY